MKKITTLWNRLSNIGIDSQISHIERKKIKILNQGATIGLLLQGIVCSSYIFNLQFAVIAIGSVIISFLFIILYLNYKRKYQTAQLLVNLILPILIVLLGVFYGKQTGIQYDLLIFIITAILFNKRTITKLSLVVYNIILYFFLIYFWSNYESIYQDQINEIGGVISFIATASIIIVLVFNFLKENEKYNKENQLLLDSLSTNNDELRQANEALERFAYIASHDLKTPLRTISGYTELLERDFNKGTYNNFTTYFKQIKQGTLQMNDLIKATLEYSRVNNLEIQKDWIDLNSIVQSISNAYTNDQSISIISNDLPTIFAEENQVLSLFQNLIENGIKYNQQKVKTITIKCISLNDYYIFSIADNGIGIDKKYHDQIFTMFKRLHTNQQYEGTGLGLAICEKVVAKMDGKIWIESEVGIGTTFFIELHKKIEN